MTTSSPPLVELRGITKSFGPVAVLKGVNLSLRAGEVHALLGENGAGKSTLMKVLGGYHVPSEGSITIDGQTVTFKSSQDAEALGIILIHQEFNLVEDLTVAQNIYLGREPGGFMINDAVMLQGAKEALQRLEANIDPSQRVSELSVAQKQFVEIAKALARNARILIMDEPTATLTIKEAQHLLQLIRELRDSGVAIVYISHKLDEIKRVADVVTILRDGQIVGTYTTAELSPHQMASLMVGRELEDMFPDQGPLRPEKLLTVQNLSVPGWSQNISFDLYAGEVLGFAGLVGAGRTESFEGLVGLRPATVGQVQVNNQTLRVRSPAEAQKVGLVYLSEDRKGKGLLVDFPLTPNLTLATVEQHCHPLLDVTSEAKAMASAQARYNIRAASPALLASSLSGGNQQKLALAKILESNPQVVVLDEPTRGVDVGAKREIYHLIHALAQQGKGIIVISSELPELLGLCHRVIVMHSGNITGSLTGADLNEQEVIQYATGLKRQSAAPQQGVQV